MMIVSTYKLGLVKPLSFCCKAVYFKEFIDFFAEIYWRKLSFYEITKEKEFIWQISFFLSINFFDFLSFSTDFVNEVFLLRQFSQFQEIVPLNLHWWVTGTAVNWCDKKRREQLV